MQGKSLFWTLTFWAIFISVSLAALTSETSAVVPMIVNARPNPTRSLVRTLILMDSNSLPAIVAALRKEGRSEESGFIG